MKYSWSCISAASLFCATYAPYNKKGLREVGLLIAAAAANATQSALSSSFACDRKECLMLHLIERVLLLSGCPILGMY